MVNYYFIQNVRSRLIFRVLDQYLVKLLLEHYAEVINRAQDYKIQVGVKSVLDHLVYSAFLLNLLIFNYQFIRGNFMEEQQQPDSVSNNNNHEKQFQCIKLNGSVLYGCKNCKKRLKNRSQMKNHCQFKCRFSSQQKKGYQIIRENNCRIYSCISCKKKLKNATEMINHCSKRQCSTFNQRLNQRKIGFEQYLQSVVQQGQLSKNSSMKFSSSKLQNLQHRIECLQAERKQMKFSDLSMIGQSSLVNSQAQIIAKQLSNLFYAMSLPKIQKALTAAAEAQINIINAKQNLESSMIKQMEQLVYDCFQDSFSKNLDQFWNILSKQFQIKKKDPTTISRYKKGYMFWRKYTDRNFQYMAQIVQDLRDLNNYDLRCAVDFYNSMKRLASHLFDLKQLPQIITRKQKILKRQYQRINLETVKTQIYFLLSKNLYELAVDLWVCATLGLRKSQLLQIFLQNQQGIIADSISIIQRKNLHRCIRIIPNSLKILLKMYKTTFPMTLVRLKSVRKYAIQKFKRFYGLRSMYITSVVTAVLQKNEFHRRSTTTVKHYLDDTSIQLINNMFLLDGISQARIVQNSNLQLKFNADKMYEWINLKPSNLQISIEAPDFELNQIKDAVLLDNTEWSEISNDKQRAKIMVEGTVFQKYGQQLEDQIYYSISEAIAAKVKQNEGEGILQFTSSKIQNNRRQQQILKVAKQIYNIDIILLYSSKIMNEKKDRNGQKLRSNQLLLVKFIELDDQAYFRMSDNDIIFIKSKSKNPNNGQQKFKLNVEIKQPQVKQVNKQLVKDQSQQKIVQNQNRILDQRPKNGVNFQNKVTTFVSHIQQRYHLKISKQNCVSIKQILLKRLDDRHFLSIYSQYFKNSKQNQENITKFCREVYSLQLVWIRGYQEQINWSLPEIFINQNTIILLEVRGLNNHYFSCSQAKIRYIKTKKRIQLMNKKNNFDETPNVLLSKIPNCSKCKKAIKVRECQDHQYYTCQLHQLFHKCLSVEQKLQIHFSPMLFVRKIPHQIESKFCQIVFSKKKNNIYEIIKKTYRQYVKRNYYYKNCPKGIIQSKIDGFVDDKTKEIILQNRLKQEFLPLKIKKLSQTKGYGVIATETIAKDTLICSYLGCIGTNQNLMNGQDSQFHCGYISSKSYLVQIIIFCRQYANIGRFINTSTNGEQINCKAEIILMPNDNDQSQIGVVYISKRKIQINEQLAVEYPLNILNRGSKKYQTLKQLNIHCKLINQLYKYYPIQFKKHLLTKIPNSTLTQINQVSFKMNSTSVQIPDKIITTSQIKQSTKKVVLYQSQRKMVQQVQFIGRLAQIEQQRKQFSISQQRFQSLFNFCSHLILIKKDGLCLLRSIAFSYFIQYFQKANQFFFSSQDFTFDLQKLQLKQDFRISFNKQPILLLNNLRNLWNGNCNVDVLIVSKLMKDCLNLIQQQESEYKYNYMNNQIDDLKLFLASNYHNIKVPQNKQLSYPLLQAASQLLKVTLVILVAPKNENCFTHLVGKYQSRIKLFLVDKFYHIFVDSSSLLASKKQTSDQKLNQSLLIPDFHQIQDIPCIQSTEADLLNMQQFLIKIQLKFKQFGAIKVKLPFKLKRQEIIHQLKTVKIKQVTQKISMLNQQIYKYENITQKTQSFQQFWKDGQKQDLNLPTTIDRNLDVAFWNQIKNGQVKAFYSPDNSFSCCQKANYFWSSRSLKTFFNRIVTQKIIGINTPYTFIGRKNSVFGWHKQDYNLSAINFQILGHSKVWYIIPENDSHKFESFVSKYSKKGTQSCEYPLLHKQLIINPYLLQTQNINVKKIFQNQNQMVVVFNKSYHSGFNTGTNINQAINYGNINWLSYYKNWENCQCINIPKLNQQQLILNLQNIEDIQVIGNPIVKKFINDLKNRIKNDI